MDKNKCPKSEYPKYFVQNPLLLTIIENYGKVPEKIIFIL
jgi:hypothetical protein